MDERASNNGGEGGTESGWLAELEVTLRQAQRLADLLLLTGADTDSCRRLLADIARARCHAGALQAQFERPDRRANEPFWSELLLRGDRRRR